jgi:hypothetical protein
VADKVFRDFNGQLKAEVLRMARIASPDFFTLLQHNLLATNAKKVELGPVREELKSVIMALQDVVRDKLSRDMADVKMRFRFLRFYQEFEAAVLAEYVFDWSR